MRALCHCGFNVSPLIVRPEAWKVEGEKHTRCARRGAVPFPGFRRGCHGDCVYGLSDSSAVDMAGDSAREMFDGPVKGESENSTSSVVVAEGWSSVLNDGVPMRRTTVRRGQNV